MIEGCSIGFPHSDISGSKVAWHLPEAFRRHAASFIAFLKPRHPPYALSIPLSARKECLRTAIICCFFQAQICAIVPADRRGCTICVYLRSWCVYLRLCCCLLLFFDPSPHPRKDPHGSGCVMECRSRSNVDGLQLVKVRRYPGRLRKEKSRFLRDAWQHTLPAISAA